MYEKSFGIRDTGSNLQPIVTLENYLSLLGLTPEKTNRTSFVVPYGVGRMKEVCEVPNTGLDNYYSFLSSLPALLLTCLAANSLPWYLLITV